MGLDMRFYKNRLPTKNVGILIGFLTAGGLHAAEVYFPPDIPMPANITEQFQVQGEYSGTITGGGKLGAWVVSMGNDVYDVKYLPGGLVTLPGDAEYGGWDGKTKYEVGGVRTTAFNTSSGYKGVVSGTGANRTITGTTPDGKAFTLNRVVRKSPTENLQPKPEWNAKYWFRENNSADLANWSGTPTMKHGGALYRGVTSKIAHGTVYLHIEIRQAFSPLGREQIRSNSGVYFKNMHEMQVLDSFGLSGAANEMGAVYGNSPPKINSCLPPMTWQTYDVYYTPAGGEAANITAYLNGVLVQDNYRVNGRTEGGFPGTSIMLQNHDAASEVVYRNIWVVDNATTTSLPWNTILAAAVPPTVVLRHDFRAGKKLQNFRFETFMGRDFLGRKASVQPSLMP